MTIESMGNRCPVCRAEFTSIATWKHDLYRHYMEQHVTVEDIMRAIERKERENAN